MIIIRRAVPEDAGQLTQIAIVAKSHWDYPEEWIQLWIPALTISPDYILENEVWVAFENENVAGWYSLKYDDDYLWLDNLWVLPEYMGHGIGRELFEHALERSRLCGAHVLKIEADPNAQNFYEKMGARQTGEQYGEVAGQTRVLPVMEINVLPHA